MNHSPLGLKLSKTLSDFLIMKSTRNLIDFANAARAVLLGVYLFHTFRRDIVVSNRNSLAHFFDVNR